MSATVSKDVLSKSLRMSFGSASVREVFTTPEGDVFQRSGRESDDEDELKWAAIERLSTDDGLRKDVLKQTLDDGKVVHQEVNVTNLRLKDKKKLMESILKIVEEDNERFLVRLRDSFDRVGIDIPKIEVRFEHLSIEGDTYVGSRALPTLWNATINFVEGALEKVKLIPSKKRVVKILHDVSGIVKPSRMTLLLGPPGGGKTTLLKALAAVPDKDLRVAGKVSYCGHELLDFIPQRTCAYISQHDLHHGEMTVRETLDFAGRSLGVGTRYELLKELSRREKELGIKPDPGIDAFMKATAILGLDTCADIMVGDQMRRGISGGQKKRLTTGEMLVGPAKVFFMDEISMGLDSSTTFQIVKYMRQMVHIMDVTMIISLLQPAPETFELFDDIILLSEGHIVYQGPRANMLEFFESVGFKCPERKGIADFLQEVTSLKDQEQYWFRKKQPYRFITVAEFAEHFSNFHVGRELFDELGVAYDKIKAKPIPLHFSQKCMRNSFLYMFKTFQIIIMAIIAFTVFSRTEMKVGQIADGNKFCGALFLSLINVMFNGTAELALTLFRLPVFFKQRDSLFYPAWAFALPIWLLRIPLSFMESLIWIVLTYYTIGFAPAASRFFRQFLVFFALHQMTLSLFRFIAAIGRTLVVANTIGTFTLLIVFVFGGFIVAKDDLGPWIKWGYYVSPMSYAQNAIAINEFLDKRWSTSNNDTYFSEETVGKVILKSRSMYLDEYMFWICVIALFAFSFLFNFCFILALTYMNPSADSKSVTMDDDKSKKNEQGNRYPKESTEKSSASTIATFEGIDMDVRNNKKAGKKRGMVLPFQPLALAFNHVNYYVDMPAVRNIHQVQALILIWLISYSSSGCMTCQEMKAKGTEETCLQLLRNVSGAFRPAVLTALVGVSGAGKTTLLDVLAGRKTGGYTDGSIIISGYPKNQSTFARISGYCEQNDIHSPHVTVYESLIYSAWLRLSPDVKKETRKVFTPIISSLGPQIVPAYVSKPCSHFWSQVRIKKESHDRLTASVKLVNYDESSQYRIDN
ncbi:hypothetical protein R3W88_015620 [Solanum pinnatisectum]|uniref:ABC transporter domain-containing protein n=1 Tax=Solanum pinnatisectum TaxID=50273 RepID=A0AAV9KZC2_9SOLN|nr:hypothetical protein R3W88_015620 [Solanum pinnatisectum]